MKNITLFLLAIFLVSAGYAQQMLHYNFENSLNEINNAGPALTVLGEQGTYVLDTLNELEGTTRTVYRFARNNGVQFNNIAASGFIGEDYSIEIYFVFDELSSWKRVVDWKNRKTDRGAYIYSGKLNFYNILYSQEAPVEAGQYTYYVITRTASTKSVLIYTDAEVKIDFIDNSNDALVDMDGVINFFYDDLQVPNEASAGAVAMIKLYNYPLTQTEISEKWDQLGSQVFGLSTSEVRVKTRIYPNPASTTVKIDLSQFAMTSKTQIEFYNENGQKVYQIASPAGELTVEAGIGFLPRGMYLVRASQGNTVAVSRLIVN